MLHAESKSVEEVDDYDYGLSYNEYMKKMNGKNYS